MRQRDELEQARQRTLMQFQRGEREAGQTFSRETQERGFEHADTARVGEQNFRTREREAGEDEAMARQERGFEHSERMQREAFKNSGLSIQPTEQGVAVVDARNPGKPATILKGPDGKPLTSLKDTAATVTAVSNGIKSAIDMGDLDRAKNLSDVLYNMVQNKTGKAGGGQPKVSAPDYGTVVDGYKFIGKPTDNPNDQKNWQAITQEKPSGQPQGGLLNQPTPQKDTRVSVPGMGMVNKSDIPARLEQFMKLYKDAQDQGDTAKMVELGKTIQAMREAQSREGI